MRRIGRLSGYARGFVFLSLCYVVLRWILQFVALRFRSDEFKDLAIVVLRHELAILRRQPRRRRCFGGIGAWWRNVGRTRIEPVARRCGVRFARWSFVWRETTRWGYPWSLAERPESVPLLDSRPGPEIHRQS